MRKVASAMSNGRIGDTPVATLCEPYPIVLSGVTCSTHITKYAI